jgi:hypothetical protein
LRIIISWGWQDVSLKAGARGIFRRQIDPIAPANQLNLLHSAESVLGLKRTRLRPPNASYKE